MAVRIVGIDCATVDTKIGIALGEVTPDSVSVTKARVCSKEETAADIVTRWLLENPTESALFAIDAPLGWPKELASTLIHHRAGAPLAVEPNLMFRRATDRFVQKTIGKTPLDVGADRIARTAHSALQLLANVGRRMNVAIPLAWSPEWSGIAAIEVYPAATLLTRKLTSSGYKKRHNASGRESMIRDLRSYIMLPESCQMMIDNADALDAAVCVLAGADFVRGQVHQPSDRDLAKREGWIWFRSVSATHGLA